MLLYTVFKVCYNKIAVKILIVGDKEIYLTLIYWSGGGSVSEGKYYE